MTVLRHVLAATRFAIPRCACPREGTDPALLRRIDALAHKQDLILDGMAASRAPLLSRRVRTLVAGCSLMFGLVLVAAAVVLSVRSSSLNDQAAEANLQAQTDRIQAIQALGPLFQMATAQSPAQLRQTMADPHRFRVLNAEIGTAGGFTKDADNIENAAATASRNAAHNQLIAQIGLAIGRPSSGEPSAW